MPYVKPDRRSAKIGEFATDSEGDLNYHITRACQVFIAKHGRSYASFNAVVGVLECAKLEFYRRAVAAYEDTKIAENGDVY
jgi:hypothetical protein